MNHLIILYSISIFSVTISLLCIWMINFLYKTVINDHKLDIETWKLQNEFNEKIDESMNKVEDTLGM